MERKGITNFIIKLFWIFMIGSIFGYIAETAVVLIEKGHFENRQGLIYGPFVQIYGIGAIAYYLIAPKIKDNKNIFFIFMIIGGIMEYLFSYIQQVLFGTVSWDYSNYMIHLNGRTSLLHCIYWGLSGVLFMKLIYPLVEKANIQGRTLKYVTTVLAMFMICNITISWGAATRQEERYRKIPPRGKIDVLLDRYYPDEIMNKVYANKINK